MVDETTEEEKGQALRIILDPEHAKKIEASREYFDKALVIQDDPDFEIREDGVYMKSVPQVTVPKALFEFAVRLRESEETLQPLKKFWRWCALNPDPAARRDLFPFLLKYRFNIHPSGFFFAYRNAVLVGNDTEALAQRQAIDAEYRKILGQKSNPSKFYLHLVDGVLKATSNQNSPTIQFDGKDLRSLFQEKAEVRYTDAYTKKMRIEIGKPVAEDRTKCNPDPSVTCSRGLHVGAFEWLNAQSGFGAHSLLVLVNPMHVVAVPHSDNYGKMRLCEYLPVSTLQRDEYGNIIGLDPTNPVVPLEMAYNYAEACVADLEAQIKTVDKEFAMTISDFLTGVTFNQLIEYRDRAAEYIRNNTVFLNAPDPSFEDEDDLYDEDEW